MAVRHVSGNIVLESWFTGGKKRAKFWTLPFVRGIFMLVDSCLLYTSRLRRVARQCVNYGQRVQNSVFECLLDAAQYRQVRHLLEELIDREKDSLRFYNLGDHYHTRVEHLSLIHI